MNLKLDILYFSQIFILSVILTMALNVFRTEKGILIDKHYLFNPTEIEMGIINLISNLGEEMAYDRGNLLSIDFPGEYDLGGNIIKVFLGKGDKLNFLVFHEDVKFGIIQSPDVLEMDEVCDMQTWIFTDESVAKKLDQLEMEGNRINIMSLDLVSFDEVMQSVQSQSVESVVDVDVEVEEITENVEGNGDDIEE